MSKGCISKMKKFLLILFSCVLTVMLLASCGDDGSGQGDIPEADAPGESSFSDTDTDAVTTEVPETQPVIAVPEFVNPLTGLGTDTDLSALRPVAIMINNLKGALPQEGISDCDIMYECLVEGGITRLMVVTSDYSSLGSVGSIRSCRHYYLDLASNYDAIYIHAGGSDQGYIELKQRKIDNLDGVNMYVPGMFFRDEKRLETMKYEHTLMTTGEKIAAGIAYKKYRTEASDELKGKEYFSFAEYGSVRELSGDDAQCVLLPYSSFKARFDYNADTNSYYRYQFGDMAHIDGTTGEQISFTNILVLICDVNEVGDKKGHLDIITENKNGKGYYISGGKYEEISWSKPTEDSPTTYFGADGNELVINRGKTFISIFPDYNAENVDFNYTVSAE